MSQSSPSTISAVTSALTHSSSLSQSGTNLLDFPPNANFKLYIKSINGGVEPNIGGILHVSELIPDDEDHVLVCFGSMNPSDWNTICNELLFGNQLGLKPLLVATLDNMQIGCGLWKANDLAGLHGLTNSPNHPMVFSPNQTLMRLLKIDCDHHRTRNALVLIRNGHVVAKWVSEGDGDKPHDWTNILSVLN